MKNFSGNLSRFPDFLYICIEIILDMEKETRKAIAAYSQQIDALEKTRELIETSNVLCFTTMDRGPEETVTIEFDSDNPSGTNSIFVNAEESMLDYLDAKIEHLERKIDELLKK